MRSAERNPDSERRASGGLRDNVGWTVAKGGGNRFSDRPRLRIKKSRIVVLGIALVAGSFAAYLASQLTRPTAPAAMVVAPKAASQILVASQAIAVGQRLSPALLAWQPWPEQSLQHDFITAADAPAAITDMSGLMARSEFLPGDPIRREKLVAGGGSFLSASLDKGMRAVSVEVNAVSASGGFVSPNDRVDVVLTRSTAARGVSEAVFRSETILHNVLVLAINSTAGGGAAPAKNGDELHGSTFTGQAIATLALDASDADLVVSASAIGKLSLLLRPAVDSSQTNGQAKALDSANQAIRMSSPFWLQ